MARVESGFPNEKAPEKALRRALSHPLVNHALPLSVDFISIMYSSHVIDQNKRVLHGGLLPGAFIARIANPEVVNANDTQRIVEFRNN